MLQPATVRKIIKELTQLRNNPPEDIRVQVDEEDVLQFVGIIAGPEGTPYHGGWFRVKFAFGDEFPASPPKCRFMTRIFHPNVSSSGEICVNTLKKDWKSTYGITHILTVIKCLLIYPNPESALDEEAGKMLLEDYAGFAKRAKLMTEVHAARGGKPTEFEDTKDEEDPLFSSEPLFGPSFADSAPSTSTSKPRATKSRTRQPSQPASDSPTISSVTLPASSSTPTAAITPSSAFISTSGSAPSAVPLQVSAQSNGAPPRSSPAPEKEGTNATTKKDASGKDKEQSGAKGKEALKTTGVGKTLKRPASAVSGGVKVEGGEKKKKGLKRL